MWDPVFLRILNFFMEDSVLEDYLGEAVNRALSGGGEGDPLRAIAKSLNDLADARDGALPSSLEEAAGHALNVQGDRDRGWSAEQWLRDDVLVHNTVCKGMLAPLHKLAEQRGESLSGAHALEFVRRVGSRVDGRDHLARLLHAAVEEIADAVHEKMAALVAAGQNATTHEMLNNKFVHNENLAQYKSGDFMSFHKGLDGLIGSPNPEIHKTMMREHCSSDDSLLEFRASNYQTATTSQIEWYFVADPNSPPKTFKIIRMEEARRDDRIAAWRYGANRRNPTLTSMPFPKARSVKGWPQERRYGSVGHRGRSPFPPSFFEAEMREKNRQLNERGASEITMEEFLGARLYTGP